MSEWKPISTAPRDGTHFLGFNNRSKQFKITWHGKTSHVPLFGWCECECGDGEDVSLWDPTHWQHLPEPPEDEKPINDWQPIRTVPRDGTFVHVGERREYMAYTLKVRWNGVEWEDGNGKKYDRLPTHWQPIIQSLP